MPSAILLCLLLGNTAAPAPAQAALPPRYGDAGTSHFGLVLGLGSGSRGYQWAAGADYGYFVWDGVAPGVDVLVTGGKGLLTSGLVLGVLRLVPLRTRSVAVFLVGRAGRVLLSDHGDGWGAGGGAGMVFHMGGRVGLQVAYDALHLSPSSFCADLATGCLLHGIAIGIVVGF